MVMERSTLETIEGASSFYRGVSDPTARAILDFLIDHPNERFDGAALVQQLGLAEHRDVARATYWMGQVAADLGLWRPWIEGQLGYLLPDQPADFLRQARAQIGPASAA
jgi:hypothetical protein